MPGVPGTLAGGTLMVPGTVAGGIGPPATGGLLVKIDDAEPGMPWLRSGGFEATCWMMLTHGTPGTMSAIARGLNKGAVQKHPTVAIAVTAAMRVVVRDMVPPFLW
ncbi:hypothetical protein [Mycobacterium sp. DL592]|uniref:hypothetical protein n=1 Tax=Mycobacterium sp. DL592 TaxID=2675524 RepID=UPI0014211542|nr:hypothetical protein [Mycobacterium sp. DL592]